MPSTGNALLDTLLLVLTGSVGTKALDWFLNRKTVERQEDRSDEQVEFEQAAELRKEAEALRKELRADIDALRSDVGRLRADVDVWKQAYFDLFHTATEIRQQYVLVTTYLNAILTWLREQNIQIPMPIPVLTEPPTLPTAPFPKEK